MLSTKFFKQLKGAATTREDKLLLFYAIIVFFGGALRKWVIESSIVGNLVLMLQLVLPFLFWILGSNKKISPFSQFSILRVYFGYLVFHIFLPTQHTIFHGMIGVLIHGGFWVGLFYYFANRDKYFTPRLLPYFIIFSVVEIVLGFIQYTLPQGHILNKYALDTIGSIAVVGDSVRITGTFSYISGYVSFLTFYPFFIFSLIRMNFSTWFVSIGISFGLIVCLMSGSRGAVMLFLSYLIVVLVSLYQFKDILKIGARMAIPSAILVSILLLTGVSNFQGRIEKAYENFNQRFQTGLASGEQTRRLTWDFTYFNSLDRFPNILIGSGMGSMYQGSMILFGKSNAVVRFGYVEGELPKLVFEGGIVFIILKIILVSIAVMQLSFKQPLLRFVIWFSLVYFIPIGFQVHNASFLLLGIILIDNISWRQQQKASPPLEVKVANADLEEPSQIWGYPRVGEEVK